MAGHRQWRSGPSGFGLETHRDGRFFLYVHYIDPHSPYQAPVGYRGLYSEQEGPGGSGLKVGSRGDRKIETMIDKYDEEIRYIDGRFGSLLGQLKKWELMDDTIVVFLSDHGEGVKEHGFLHHSYGGFSEVIDVPLIIRSPRAFSSGKFPHPVQHIDLFPTILELSGIDPRQYPLEGKNPGQEVDLDPQLEESLKTLGYL